jgi:hypothetical protein
MYQQNKRNKFQKGNKSVTDVSSQKVPHSNDNEVEGDLSKNRIIVIKK